MTKDEEREQNVENVARAAVLILGLAEDDGDFVKIRKEFWLNYKRVIETCLLKKKLELYEFEYGVEMEVEDIEAFHKMMREKHPDIIGRKRFCAHVEEVTEALIEDCTAFRVKVVPINE